MDLDVEHEEDLAAGSTTRFKWPDVPRLCFAAGPDANLNACIGWVQSRPNELDGYVEGYHRAATMLFESAIANNTSPDFVIFPLAFLWRHHLELALKDVIASGRVLEDKPWSFPDGHRLLNLWMEAKPYVQRCGAKDAPELTNVELNIREFEKIDPYADGFRYPLNRDRSAASMPNAPQYMNLRVLQDAMQALGNFFSGVRGELSSQLQYKQDWESEQRREMEAEYRRDHHEY